jgi:hypothetical protein
LVSLDTPTVQVETDSKFESTSKFGSPRNPVKLFGFSLETVLVDNGPSATSVPRLEDPNGGSPEVWIWRHQSAGREPINILGKTETIFNMKSSSKIEKNSGF